MNPRLPFLLLMVVLSFISPVVIAQSAKVLSREEIAQRVEDTLRNAAFCEVTVTVTQIPIGDGGKLKSGTGPVVVHSIMRKDGFKSLAYMNGKLIMAFAFCDGRVEEFRPRAKNRPLLQYDATSLSGMEDTVLQEEEDCLIGGLTFSWVGVPPKSGVDPASDRAGSYGNKIRNGEQGADVQEQGRTCFVFREIIPVGDRQFENVLYIDKTSFLVLRWDSFQPGVQRIRICNKIQVSDSVPQNLDWHIAVGSKE
jgi:hypothetical protein